MRSFLQSRVSREPPARGKFRFAAQAHHKMGRILAVPHFVARRIVAHISEGQFRVRARKRVLRAKAQRVAAVAEPALELEADAARKVSICRAAYPLAKYARAAFRVTVLPKLGKLHIDIRADVPRRGLLRVKVVLYSPPSSNIRLS